VTVVTAAELAAQPIVDHRAKFLHSMKDLSGCVTALATQRDPCAVLRP
jgi:hypothetical protein